MPGAPLGVRGRDCGTGVGAPSPGVHAAHPALMGHGYCCALAAHRALGTLRGMRELERAEPEPIGGRRRAKGAGPTGQGGEEARKRRPSNAGGGPGDVHPAKGAAGADAAHPGAH
ncbi:hypothetical protein GCM10009601_54980 [Streptomyces thermospinosisporus]|uniref:Uncharacterized protein n=1 Tax=Streptomyces thermospinosisporus TaxID=161482 RepID=A0ABP4JWH8_9ACTN